jgi:DNA mismatch endonuclease (patch repair protein)
MINGKSIGLKGIKRFKSLKLKKRKFTSKVLTKFRRSRRRSSLELKVYKWLKEEGIAFTKEKAISKCHVDICFEPDVAIELNGCYWHRHKKCFPSKGKENTEIRERDARRHKFLKSRGYKVVVIWECDINTNPDKVKKLLKKLAGK